MIKEGLPPYLECSSKGDKRFSAFYARIKKRNNRSIEELYQAAKQFEDGSYNKRWQDAKGQVPVNIAEVRAFYAKLWDEYIDENPELIQILHEASGLSDLFGQSGHANQATELWRIRSERKPLPPPPPYKGRTPLTNHVLVLTTPQSYRIKTTVHGDVLGTQLNINAFCKPFLDEKFDPRLYRWVIEKKYRYYDKKQQLLYLPRYDLPRFQQFCSKNGVTTEIQELPLCQGKPVSVSMKPGLVPKDQLQADAINFLSFNEMPVRGLALQTGRGKCVSLDTLVKIPGGWTRMWNVRVGDTITAHDGTPTKIIGVYPQGKLPAYRVTFADGRHVDTCGEHLWQSFYVNTSEPSRWQIRSTLEMKRLISMPNPRVYIPLSKPEVTPDVELPIDPYVMGYLIGNGCFRHGSVKVTTVDSFVLDTIRNSIPENLELKHVSRYDYVIRRKNTKEGLHVWVQHLRQLGVIEHLSYQKFIPNIYLHGSIEQKEALIQGLMDSDGFASLDGTANYTTTSVVLANQMVHLIRSLGSIASVTPKTKTYTYKGKLLTGRLAYQVNIRPTVPSRLFRLPRKKDRIRDDNQYAQDLKLRVASIEPIEAQEMQCIAVDHPDRLFVVNDFIVTHNTFSAIKTISNLGVRGMICVPNMMEQWTKAIFRFTELEKDDVYQVQGMPSLAKLLTRIDKSLKPKIILASIPTLRSYSDGGDSYMNFPPFDEMLDRLGVGIRVVDEGHLNFHANFIVDLRLNAAVTIPMTATFDVSKTNLLNIFNSHYPIAVRFGEADYKKYVNIHQFSFGMGHGDIPAKVYKSADGYNHAMFENWLLTKGRVKLQDMIDEVYCPIIQSLYINKIQHGEKLLILCSTIEMCKHLCKELSDTYQGYKVAIYIGESDDSVLDENDIIISTPKSAGTGRDISNLHTMFTTVSVRSAPQNKQMLGRLRQLDNPPRTPIYAYCYCRSIPSQVQHAEVRKNLLEPLALNFYQHNL